MSEYASNTPRTTPPTPITKNRIVLTPNEVNRMKGSKSRTKPRKAKLRKRPSLSTRIERAFDPSILADICAMDEEMFVTAHGMDRIACPDIGAPFYAFKDNKSPILAVAHLDTVAHPNTRAASFADTAAGPVIHSRALDDRLGAYVLAHLLPALGIPKFDLLVTTGEEIGRSTAQHFTTTRDYNWIIEFDRGGTDVVLYDYEDDATADLVEAHATVGIGSYSDISWMEHVGVKAFNWGVGYADYHGPRAHAYLRDTFGMVEAFCGFWEANRDVQLPHRPDLWWLKDGKDGGNGGDSDTFDADRKAMLDAWGIDDDSTSMGDSRVWSDCEMCGKNGRVTHTTLYGVDLCRDCERALS